VKRSLSRGLSPAAFTLDLFSERRINMKKYPSLILSLLLACSPLIPVLAQQQEDNQDDDVVRITTNLVQVDAVVTDKEGRQVTDLRPEEFVISEDGRPQEITNFSYITVNTTPSTTTPPASDVARDKSTPDKEARNDKNTPTVPPARLRPEQVRRTIALVVDDLGLSFESVGLVRKALKKYVAEMIQPGDLVAVLRTSAGLGALQQFTADRRVLGAAIERVRWFPGGRAGASPFEARTPLDVMSQAVQREDSGVDAGGASIKEVEDFRTDLFATGTLGAVNYVVRGLRELPGRKAVVLFSDGIRIFNDEAVRQGKSSSDNSERIREALLRLVDLSNRASVVIYTMDARGLQTLGYTAADVTADPSQYDRGRGQKSVGQLAQESSALLGERSKENFVTQDGLSYLARQTGGLFIKNTNDLGAGIGRVLDDQKGYYLIGYRPHESTFEAKSGQRRFHNLKVSVKRPGLTVRSRSGFYGVPEKESSPKPSTPAQQIMAALTSPFNASGVDVRLTSIFGSDAGAGSYMRSLVYVDASDLSFKEEADGWRKAVLDVAAVTFDGEGRPIDQVNQSREVRVSREDYERLIKSGLNYMLNVPIKKAGAYQLRIAVRDTVSERTGSASQYVEVPDLSKGYLALSGIAVSSIDPASAKLEKASSSAQPKTISTESNAQSSPAVRQVHKGMFLDYGYVIYNAQQDRSTGKPNVTTQVRLFRDGQIIFIGRVSPLDINQQRDWRRLTAGGSLQIGSEMTPGDYVLQVIVTDLAAKGKPRTITQWTDFEVVK
jgi:VWFA-related protein